MKVLFVHDHRFYEENGQYYSTKFSPKTWQPYLQGGNEVLMYARKTEKKCVQLCSAENVSFHLTKYYTSSVSAIKNYYSIKKELNEIINKSDMVIVRLPSVLGVIAANVTVSKNKKIMAEVVGDAYDAYKYYGNVSGRLLAPLFRYLNKEAIIKSSAVLYVTKEYLQKKYPATGVTCGCSDALLDSVANDILQRRLAKIENMSDPIICGQIGNISMFYKGYEVMFRVIKNLRCLGVHLEYHVVGGGNPDAFYKKANEYGIGNCVYYDGMMEHSKINDFFDNIDIYVHPAFTEGLPRVVVEAISRACPCLVSNAGGTPELGNPMFIHKIGDDLKLFSDIQRLVTNKELMKSAAEENFMHAEYYYSTYLLPRRMAFYKQFFEL